MTIDVECEARLLLERAGFGLDDVPGARRLVASILGPRAIEMVPRRLLRGAEGEVCRINGRHRIFLSNTLRPARAAFVALHELAHVHLGELHHCAELEEACDGIAGALLCPQSAFRAAVCEHKTRWEQLALDFGAEASCVALRYGEVLGKPLCLVSPKSVRVRGQEWGWPEDEQDIRRLAKTSSPHLIRETMPDDRRRVLLRAVG